jgi:hypothetical protein
MHLTSVASAFTPEYKKKKRPGILYTWYLLSGFWSLLAAITAPFM